MEIIITVTTTLHHLTLFRKLLKSLLLTGYDDDCVYNLLPPVLLLLSLYTALFLL